MTFHSFLTTTHVCLFLILLSATSSVWASPLSSYRLAFIARQTVQPYFPDTPASCPICEKGYPTINTCAEAAPALANFSSVCTDYVTHIPTKMTKNNYLLPYRYTCKKVILNPGEFISVIKCSCTDTFKSVFPQCADWCAAIPPFSPKSESLFLFHTLTMSDCWCPALRERTRRPS